MCVFGFMYIHIYQYSHIRRWQQCEQVDSMNNAAAKCQVNTSMMLYASCSAHSHHFLFNYPHGISWSTVYEASSVCSFLISPIASSHTSGIFFVTRHISDDKKLCPLFTCFVFVECCIL